MSRSTPVLAASHPPNALRNVVFLIRSPSHEGIDYAGREDGGALLKYGVIDKITIPEGQLRANIKVDIHMATELEMEQWPIVVESDLSGNFLNMMLLMPFAGPALNEDSKRITFVTRIMGVFSFKSTMINWMEDPARFATEFRNPVNTLDLQMIYRVPTRLAKRYNTTPGGILLEYVVMNDPFLSNSRHAEQATTRLRFHVPNAYELSEYPINDSTSPGSSYFANMIPFSTDICIPLQRAYASPEAAAEVDTMYEVTVNTTPAPDCKPAVGSKRRSEPELWTAPPLRCPHPFMSVAARNSGLAHFSDCYAQPSRTIISPLALPASLFPLPPAAAPAASSTSMIFPALPTESLYPRPSTDADRARYQMAITEIGLLRSRMPTYHALDYTPTPREPLVRQYATGLQSNPPPQDRIETRLSEAELATRVSEFNRSMATVVTEPHSPTHVHQEPTIQSRSDLLSARHAAHLEETSVLPVLIPVNLSEVFAGIQLDAATPYAAQPEANELRVQDIFTDWHQRASIAATDSDEEEMDS